jgi:hypothetical protein
MDDQRDAETGGGGVSGPSELELLRGSRKHSILAIIIFLGYLALLIPVAMAIIHWTTLPAWLPALPVAVMVFSVAIKVITYFHTRRRISQLECGTAEKL